MRFIIILSAAGLLTAQTQPPALLTRGLLPEPGSSARASTLRPYLGALSGYDSGPLTTSFDRGAGPFQEAQGGIESRHIGPRVELRLDYRFGLRHHPTISRLDRSSHALYFDARWRVSRRWTVMLRDAGTSSSFGASPGDAAASLQTPLFADGGPEVLHSRTIANTALADLVFSPSVRTSLSVAGDGFLVERQFRGLADVLGWRARANVAYRYSRRRTLAVAYSFTHFDHTRAFGGADYAVYSIEHSARLGKRSELALLAGAGQLRSAGVRPVELDPDIARLLGTARGAEIFRVHTWMPHITAAWTQGFGRVRLRTQAARFASDGGGLSGLARQNQVTVSLEAPLGRSWNVAGLLAGRKYRSLDTLLYDSTTAAAGISLNRRLSSRTEAVLRYEYAFYNFQRGLLHEFHRHQVSAGVLYHFRDLPAR